MRFKTQIENIDLTIEIYKDPEYKATNPLARFSMQDLEELKDGTVHIYSLNVLSRKGDQTMNHYTAGILLSADETDIQEELQEILEDFGIVEHVLKHWELNDSNNLRPSWALTPK